MNFSWKKEHTDSKLQLSNINNPAMEETDKRTGRDLQLFQYKIKIKWLWD